MKRFYSLLAFLLCCAASTWSQSGLPTFSTAESPVYHKIQFNKGSAYLSDNGNGSLLVTSATAQADGQKWALVGTKDNFRLLSAAGRYATTSNVSGTLYFSATATEASAKDLQLVEATVDGCWEIQLKDNTDNTSMNQWGGTGAGKNLGLWSAGDENNPVRFIAASAVLPDFSTGEGDDHWYFLQFCNSENTLADQGNGEMVLTAMVDPVAAQMWKFVGTADNFQLVSKAGHTAYVKGTGDAARLYASDTETQQGGFSLVESTSSYSPAWEIRANNITAAHNTLNQWAQIKVGQELGFWEPGDVNDALWIVNPANMTYADFSVVGSETWSPENDLTLWYTQPATLTQVSNKWMEYSLPIGNGQFGASLFGGVAREEILFNEKTLWTGASTDRATSYGSYQCFGSIYVTNLDDDVFGYGSENPATDYVRWLDLTNATAGTQFRSEANGVTYKREVIASAPNQVIAAHFTATEAGKLNLNFTLKSAKPGNVSSPTTYEGEGEATFSGQLTTVSFNARMKVLHEGGTLETTAEGITVRGADEVTVILAGATDYDALASTYVSETAQLAAKVKARINDAAALTWNELYTAHVNDYQALFGRVDLSLDGAANTMPTDKLVDSYKGTAEAGSLMLEQLYFAYGRYLEISSSRGVDVPSNLQGIWCNTNTPPWNSDIHSNINVQMNYWPAEPTNLSELHMPFLNYIINMASKHDQWTYNAKNIANQARGWTLFTENNIFGGGSLWGSNYVIANAWYCSHLWQHYRYTLDKDFLKEAFPTMLSCTQFWLDRLKFNEEDGTYEAPDEYSPEQNNETVISTDAPAHAQQLVYELFSNTLDAIEALGKEASGISDADLADLEEKFSKLDNGLHTEKYTGLWGTSTGVRIGDLLLREWKKYNYTYGENGHRHMSHLMCLYPFSQVSPDADATLFNAAVNSLKLRGDASTGWSMGWKINLWARALDGDHAHKILQLALRHASSYGIDQYSGGIYYNLYDGHAPFQIDGNFGACSGIAEMLMQSHSGAIHLLPALPSTWKGGSVQGLKAVGDFTVGMSWEQGELTGATIVNNQGQPLRVKCKDLNKVLVSVDGAEVEPADLGNDIFEVPSTAGQKVSIDFTQMSTGIGRVAGKTAEGNACYDLSGRRIQRPNSGIIIENGRKTLVK